MIGVRARLMRYCCGEIRHTENCPVCGAFLRDEPDPYQRQMVVTVRMKLALHTRVADASEKMGVSMNQFCLNAIEKALETVVQ